MPDSYSMSDIKRGANVAETVPATGPAAIRTTALLPGNRSSTMTTGTGPGSGSNRTGVGVGGSASSHNRLTNNHMITASPQSAVAQGTIRLDPSRHAGIMAAVSSLSSTSSIQPQKVVHSSTKHTSTSISPDLANHVGHDKRGDAVLSSEMTQSVHTKSGFSNEVPDFKTGEKMDAAINEEGPTTKRLKIDVNAANAARDSSQSNLTALIRRHRMSGESLLERRKRIQEHRKSRLQRLHKGYSQNATEHYFIQNHIPPSSLVDLQAFRKKPNLSFLNFLKATKAPQEFLQEVALAVVGHTNPSEVLEEGSMTSLSAAGKSLFNSSGSTTSSSNVQTLTVKRPASKPGLQQGGANEIDTGDFSPLNYCGRVTSAAMAQAIYLARKRESNQASQVLHPFSNLDYDTTPHFTGTNMKLDPEPRPSKFHPYSPKILSGSELGGVLYGPKLGFFPPLTSSTVPTLPTVPVTPTFHELQVSVLFQFLEPSV